VLKTPAPCHTAAAATAAAVATVAVAPHLLLVVPGQAVSSGACEGALSALLQRHIPAAAAAAAASMCLSVTSYLPSFVVEHAHQPLMGLALTLKSSLRRKQLVPSRPVSLSITCKTLMVVYNAASKPHSTPTHIPCISAQLTDTRTAGSR
jgi:hypothetical protein